MPHPPKPINRSRGGFTVVEMSIVLGITATMVVLAVPSYNRYMQNQRLRAGALDTQAAFSFASGEAVRTGRLHLVFFGEDADGNALARSVSWPSGDRNVAVADGIGRVRALAEGITGILAASGGKTTEVAVTVEPLPAATVRVEPAFIDLDVGERGPCSRS